MATKPPNYFVTGGAGFIGSNLVDRLLAQGVSVTVYDNLSTGFPEFLKGARQHAAFTFIRGDLLERTKLNEAMAGCEFVYHLAANADVRFGTQHPEKDLQQNTIATFNVLESMRHNGIRRLVFASTGSIYGEAEVFPTP
ncbi:MAG: NAD-dependent epimerase/dehydratase family protein, partial [Gemmatimonadetes bacterium]|nr:NAD-dependent epimerase/dehydratase family protein [Gemmatimonadota bacterium]